MSGRSDKHTLEDIAVRVMYFFNTMDTFLITSVLFYLAAWRAAAAWPVSPLTGIFPPLSGSVFLSAAAAIILYLILKFADFHPFFIPFSLIGLLVLVVEGGLSLNSLGLFLGGFLVLTSVVQIVFMGLPMGLAARSAGVPFRMYLNSFLVIAPTTISLPLTLCYQVFLTASAAALASPPRLFSLAFLAGAFGAAAVVRRFRKKGLIPPTFHPPLPPARYRRAIVLNIDGLSEPALEQGSAPFLKSLKRDYASVKGGAHTVYRALTNPAFASILAGVEPARHGVVNNNFHQTIRTEALPDIVPTRLYGSMHVRHFSRPGWAVSVVSLVKEGYRRADEILLEKLKRDLTDHPEGVRLWVADLSEVDYCGHAWGSYSRRHARALEHIDGLIGEFIAWLREHDFFDDTFIVVSSDHGLWIAEHSFILHPEEERVPLIFAGRGIARVVIAGKVSIMDIAANISHALAVPYVAGSRGRVFPEIYTPPPNPSMGETPESK